VAGLRGKITHSSNDLAEAVNKERVVVAGLVTRIRSLTTKSGKPMAFATIEDLQGPIELVIFPKTWERFSPFVHPDNAILVEGKVDAEGGDPKVLVDLIRPLTASDMLAAPSPGETTTDPPASSSASVREKASGQTYQPPETRPAPSETPLAPEEPDDWHLQEPASFTGGESTALEPLEDPASAPSMIVAPAVEKPKSLQPNAEPPAAPFAVKVVPPAVISFERSDVNLPVEKGSNRMLTIIMRATDDKQRDIRRLKRIMAWCAQAPEMTVSAS